MTNIRMFVRNASTTDGVVSVPRNACFRWVQSKNRSRTTEAPGDRAMITPTTVKNTIVLALDTSTVRRPNMRDPRPGARARSGISGVVPPLVFGLLALLATTTILTALTARNPRPRLTVGRDAAVIATMVRLLPFRLVYKLTEGRS